MNLNKKIGFLLDSGFPPNFISSLNEGKINVLFEKVSKEEPKEVVQTTSLTFDPKVPADAGELDKRMATKNYKSAAVDSTTGKVTLNTGKGEKKDKLISDSPELKEKFESKAQQGLFWARCNKCKTEDCKWCKMAKEFSKSTSKKQYKDMPEKKHPEKTVKYKKKETKEGYQDTFISTYTKGLGDNMKPSLLNPKFMKESELREEFENIIQKNIRPTMNKRDLLRLIEASMGDTETETKPDVKPPDVKPGPKPDKTPNPFKKPNPNPAEAIKKEIEKLQDKLDSMDDKTKIEKLEDKIKELKRELRALKSEEMSEGKSEFMSKVKEMGFLKK